MEEYETLEKLLWKSYLVDLRHRPFARQGTITFRVNDRQLKVHVKDIHFWGTRQSLRGSDGYVPISEESYESWDVHSAVISANSKFLSNFVNHSLDFDSRVYLYDSAGKSFLDSSHQKPVHLSLVTSGGHMDVVCEVIQWEEII